MGIDRGTLDQQCSQEHLLEIARRVGSNWEIYAPYLGLDDDIGALKDDHKNKTEIQSVGAFKLWEERRAFKATYLYLVENVFLKRDNASMATFVCKLLK